MPFYEYECKSCGHELEAMQKVSDPPLKKCPDCGKSQLQRLMSAPVFRLKGGGWYETDFKGDKDSQRNLADRPEADAPKDTKEAGRSSLRTRKARRARTPKLRKPRPPRRPLQRSRPQKRSRPINRRGNPQPAVPLKNHSNRSSRGGRLKKKSIKVKRRR